MSNIKEFYNQNNFPGPYDYHRIKCYPVSFNKYIKVIDRYVDNNQTVLDVGCGTGLITNVLAMRYASEFIGIDFSSAADYANMFSSKHSITNATFVKKDFFEFTANVKFDVIYAQSFLNHVPDYLDAIAKIKSLANPDGIIIVGVYNNWGKLVQRYLPVSYHNNRLALDQTANPYEIAFAHQEILDMWAGYDLLEVTPSINNRFVGLCNLFNSKNGGLTLYVFKQQTSS